MGLLDELMIISQYIFYCSHHHIIEDQLMINVNKNAIMEEINTITSVFWLSSLNKISMLFLDKYWNTELFVKKQKKKQQYLFIS